MVEADDSAWPIVTLKWVGALTDDDIVAVFARIDACLARGQRFGLLLDSRGGVGGMTTPQRRAVVTHMKDRAELTGRLMVQAVVHEHVIHRALYSLVSAINPMPFPSKVFPDSESALTWLNDKLASVRP